MKLKIGPTTFAVSFVKDLLVNGKTIWGDVNFEASEIQVESALADSPRRTTLLHEVTHVILEHAGYCETSQDEGVVNALAHGMLQVLRDNPEFVEVLCGE